MKDARAGKAKILSNCVLRSKGVAAGCAFARGAPNWAVRAPSSPRNKARLKPSRCISEISSFPKTACLREKTASSLFKVTGSSPKVLRKDRPTNISWGFQDLLSEMLTPASLISISGAPCDNFSETRSIAHCGSWIWFS